MGDKATPSSDEDEESAKWEQPPLGITRISGSSNSGGGGGHWQCSSHCCPC